MLEHWARLECRSNRKTNSVGKISSGSTCRGPWRRRRGRRGGAVVEEEIADGVQGRRRRGTVATAVGLPVAYSAPLDRSRVGMVEQWRQRTSLVAPLTPTSYLLYCATGAHQPYIGLGAPDQSASQRPSWPLGQLVEINPTFSPLISSFTFNFIPFTSFHISSQINT